MQKSVQRKVGKLSKGGGFCLIYHSLSNCENLSQVFVTFIQIDKVATCFKAIVYSKTFTKKRLKFIYCQQDIYPLHCLSLYLHDFHQALMEAVGYFLSGLTVEQSVFLVEQSVFLASCSSVEPSCLNLPACDGSLD